MTENLLVLLKRVGKQYDNLIEIASREVEWTARGAPTVEAGIASIRGYEELLGRDRYDGLVSDLTENGPTNEAYKRTFHDVMVRAASEENMAGALTVLIDAVGLLSRRDLKLLAVTIADERCPC
jgi:hypothetical protein